MIRGYDVAGQVTTLTGASVHGPPLSAVNCAAVLSNSSLIPKTTWLPARPTGGAVTAQSRNCAERDAFPRRWRACPIFKSESRVLHQAGRCPDLTAQSGDQARFPASPGWRQRVWVDDIVEAVRRHQVVFAFSAPSSLPPSPLAAARRRPRRNSRAPPHRARRRRRRSRRSACWATRRW